MVFRSNAQDVVANPANVDCALFLHPVGICVFILSIVTKKSALNLTIRICSFVNMHRDDCMKLCKRHMRCRMCLSYRL